VKKTIFITVSILFINGILSFLLRTHIPLNDQYLDYYVIKIVIKTLLILLSIALIVKSANHIPILKTNLFIIPLVGVFFYVPVSQVYDQLNHISQLNHVVFFLSCLSVGIFEELFFRKYLYERVVDYYGNTNVFFNMVVTSCCFGLAHSTNFFNSEIIKVTVITQIVLAFGLGMLFQSVLLRFKNIVLVIALHTLINYLGTYKFKLLLIPKTEDVYHIKDFLLSLTFAVIIVLVFVMISWILITTSTSKQRI